MKWFDNQHHNKVSATTLPFELRRVSETIYDEIVKRNNGYYLIRRCGVMPFTGVHNFTEFVTDGCTLVYPLPRSQQTETKLDWTPPRTQGDFTTFVTNSGGVQPEIEAKLAIDRRYVEWREDKQEQTIVVAPFNIDYNRKAYVDKIYGDEQPVGELVVDDEGNESYELAINTIEFPSLKTYDWVTHVSSHGQTLPPHMEIQAKQMIDGEEVLSSFEGKNITISDSTVGEIESATLYGETLVNVIKEPRAEVVLPYSFEDGESVTIEGTKETGSLEGVVLKGQTEIAKGKNLFNGEWESGGLNLNNGQEFAQSDSVRTGYIEISPSTSYVFNKKAHVFLYDENKNFNRYLGVLESGVSFATYEVEKYIRLYRSDRDLDNAQLEVGETCSDYVVYHDPILQSCKMPILKSCGKNLFNAFDCELDTSSHPKLVMEATSSNSIRVALSDSVAWRAGNTTLQLKPNTWYKARCSVEGVGLKEIGFTIPEANGAWNPDVVQCNASNNFLGRFRTQESGVVHLRFNGSSEESVPFDLLYKDIQIEEVESSSVAHSSYEPHKTTILSTPEEVELCGIDDVQDELDLYGNITKRTKTIRLDSMSRWSRKGNFDTDTSIIFGVNGFPEIPNNKDNALVCSHFRCVRNMEYSNKAIWTIAKDSNWNNNTIFVSMPKSEVASIEEFKTWLDKVGGLEIVALINTPVTKKVELSIVDQNGVKKDKLQVFDGVTHLAVSTPDGSLKPIISSKFEIPANIKPNTQYSIIKDSYANGHDSVPFTLDLGGAEVSSQIGERVALVTTPNTLTHSSLKPSGWGQKLTNLMIIEGDVTGRDIPYIEGMQSVENPVLLATGKNLWSDDVFKPHEKVVIGGRQCTPFASVSCQNQPFPHRLYVHKDKYYKLQGTFVKTVTDGSNQYFGIALQINNAQYGQANAVLFTLGNGKQNANEFYDNAIVGTFPESGWITHYSIVNYGDNHVRDINVVANTLQLEQFDQRPQGEPTPYQPCQSSILTMNEKIELRRIGEVRDTLDAVNGVLTQSVFEMVLNDTSAMSYNGKTNEVANFDINPSRQGLPLAKKGTKCVVENNHDNITFGTTSNFLKLQLRFNSELPSSSTPTQIMEYLSSLLQSSPIKMQYMAEEPIVKNVMVGNGEDLSLDETRVKLPRPLEKDEALEWNSSANHYQIIRYENGIKSAVEDCKELFNRYVVPLRDKVKTFVTSKASKLLLDLPYRKVRELIVPENFTVVLDNENDLVTMSWDKVVGATDYDIYLDGAFLTRVNTNQYQRREEIKGHLKVRAVNDLTMSDFTEETYVLSVPNETFISLVENRYEDGHVFTVTFADYSEIETGFRVRWSPDGREESYADVAGATGTGTVMKHTFTVPLIQDYIDIRVNSYNDTGENPIVPPIHLEMSPTPIWTYKETMGQVMLQWSNTINNTEHYVLKYKIDGTSEYVYDTILSDGYDTLTGYIELGENELAEVSIAGVVDGLTHVYCKPFTVGKSVDESLLPPQNFTYRTISENEFEFSWTDNYTCEREFELTLSHSDGRIERIIVPSTSSSTEGRKYTYRYKLQEYGYFGAKMRMNWELGNSEYTQEYTIYYLPTVVEPPTYIRKERRESEVSLQWEAQSFVDHYALYLSINGDEVEHVVKNNHYEFKINFEEEPEIRAYIRTHFLDGKVSSSSSVLQFRPCYSPNAYMAIMVNVVEEEKVLDCNIISPDTVQGYPLYTGSISNTEVSYPVSMSSITKFTMIELPMTTEFWGKSLETEGQILGYVCRSGVEQSKYPLSVLTYKPTERIIPIFETTILNYVHEAPISTEINPVRITTIGDSITAGHPNYWAETGTGDVRSQYQYWLNRKLNGQYEIINKGYGSDTTDKMVARFDKDVLETHPQYCIIQGGTNDLI